MLMLRLEATGRGLLSRMEPLTTSGSQEEISIEGMKVNVFIVRSSAIKFPRLSE